MEEEITHMKTPYYFEIESPKLKKEFQDFYEKAMDPAVVDRTYFALDGKFKCRIERALSNLAKLKNRVSQIDEVMDKDPIIYKLQDEIEGYLKQIDVLTKNEASLQDQKAQYVNKCDELKQGIQEQNLLIKQLKKENLKIKFFTYEISRKLCQTQTQFKQQETTYTSLPKIPTDVIKLRGIISNCKKKNSKILSSQSRFIFINRKNEEIFQNCFKAAQQELLKTQRTVRSKKGLFGSLYFELLNSRKKEEMKMKQIAQISTPTGYFSPQISRSPKQSFFETFHNINSSLRDDQRRQQLINLDVSFEEFKKFTPFQVLGIISLRPDVINALHQYLFPNNFLVKQSPPLQLKVKVSQEKLMREYQKLQQFQGSFDIYDQFSPSTRINTIS